MADMLRATPFFVKTAARSFAGASAYKKEGSETDSFDVRWERFVARKSRELARTTLWVAARDRQGLARKQRLMTRLVSAGTHLFAVETLLWYKSRQELRGKAHMQSLVSYFCSRTSAAFNPEPLLSVRISSWDDDSSLYPLAKAILSGEVDWLEAGIIPCRAIEHGPAANEEQMVSASARG
jgi:hypothetical protein